MPNVIKNSFSEAANHTEVLWQRGKPILDFELNEMQRIVRVNFARLLEDAVQKVYGDANGFTPGSSDDGLKATPNGANSVMFAAGSVIFKGERIRHPGGAYALSNNPGPGTATYCIYAKVEEVEIVDPNALVNLGETTRRMKMQVTLLTATGGIGGVPASSPNDTWNGGIKYYPICTVIRRANDSTVLSDDIVDLRKMLPASVVGHITRQEKFQVKAVRSLQFETENDYMQLVALAANVNPTVPTGFVFSSSSGPNGPGFYTQKEMARIFSASASSHGVVQARGIGSTGGVFGTNLGSVRFEDANTAFNASYDFVDLTSSSHGEVRIFDKRPIALDGGVPFSGPRSLIASVNGRWSATVGDGVTSYGDFTGTTALDGAVRYYIDNILGIGGTQICHIRVKPGSYTFSDSLVIPENMTVVLEAAHSGDGRCQFSAPGSTLLAAIVLSDGATLKMKGLEMVTSGSDPGRLAIISSGDLQFEDCQVEGRILISNIELGNEGSPIRVVGLRAKNCTFQAPSSALSDLSNVISVGSSPGLAGTSGRGFLAYTFEDCRFVAESRGSIIHVQGTSTTTSSMGAFTFTRCVFDVASTPSSTSPSGILVASTTDTYAGFTTVDRVTFESCYVARRNDVANVIVFDLRAANTTGTSVGVVFESIVMRDCDWRVAQSPGRIYAAWHFGENSVAYELAVGITPFWSINNFTIENTKFGYVENPTTEFGQNQNGYHRSVDDSSDYAAALGIHARSLTIDNLLFDNVTQFSKTADIMFAGCGQLRVDGLTLPMTDSGLEASGIPKFRVIHYPAPGTADASGRSSFDRVMRNFMFRSSGSTGNCASNAILELVPGGAFLLDNPNIYGRDGDISIRTDATLTLAYGSWDYSGLTIRGGRIHNAYRGYFLKGPGAGDVDHLFDYTIDEVKFSDITEQLVVVTTPDPAGNSAYFCTITNFLITKCSHRYVDRESSLPVQVNFYVGRRFSPSQGAPLNLRMTDNDFGNNCIVHLGADSTPSPVGLLYLIMGNRFDVFMKVISSILDTWGLNTGYSAAAASINANRSHVDGQLMVHNYGLYYSTLPLCPETSS